MNSDHEVIKKKQRNTRLKDLKKRKKKISKKEEETVIFIKVWNCYVCDGNQT